MLRSRYVKMPSFLVLAPFLVLLFWGLNGTRRVSAPSPEQKTSHYPVRITGFSYVTYNNQKPSIKLKADEFKVNPRKYFVFNIRPFNEATLTNARIEVHLNEGGSSELDLLSFSRDLLRMNEKGKSHVQGVGVITRGIIKGLVLQIYKADELSLVVTAQEAIIDFKKEEATLVMATIEDKSTMKLITRRSVVWRAKDKVFRIPGAYRAETPASLSVLPESK